MFKESVGRVRILVTLQRPSSRSRRRDEEEEGQQTEQTRQNLRQGEKCNFYNCRKSAPKLVYLEMRWVRGTYDLCLGT